MSVQRKLLTGALFAYVFQLIFNKKQIKESFQSEPGDEEELSLSLDDLFVLMNRLFKSGQSKLLTVFIRYI